MAQAGVMVAIALGGAAGALLRYGIARLVQAHVALAFPLGTLIANLLGCLALGFCFVWLERASPAVRTGVQVGLLGALTTFSTYAVESLALLGERQHLLAAANLFGSVVLGLLAAYLGMIAARALFGG